MAYQSIASLNTFLLNKKYQKEYVKSKLHSLITLLTLKELDIKNKHSSWQLKHSNNIKEENQQDFYPGKENNVNKTMIMIHLYKNLWKSKISYLMTDIKFISSSKLNLSDFYLFYLISLIDKY